ncbi:MAG: LPS export ABC transporter permease LptG [Thermodesulfobacteriota bacterium]
MMPIIHKYIIREVLKYLAVVLILVVGIYIAVDFFEKIDDFLEVGLPFSRALIFFAYKTPFIIAQIMPVGLLLAVLIVFGLMNKNNETIALKSAGVSIYHLLKPMIAMGLLMSFLMFFLSEVVVPLTVGRANHIWLREVRKEAAVLSREKNIWMKGNRAIIHIKHYDPKIPAIYGITLNYFDREFKLTRRVDAPKGIYRQGQWVLYDIMEQNLIPQQGSYDVGFYPERVEKLEFVPEDLKRVAKKSEEMGFKELYAYIRRIENEGYDATAQRVDLYAKFAFPFVCLLLSMVGTGIAIRGKLREGLPVSIVYGLGVAFLYWVFYSFSVSLGRGEMLPPLLAAWAPNFVFLCAGVLMLMHAE